MMEQTRFSVTKPENTHSLKHPEGYLTSLLTGPSSADTFQVSQFCISQLKHIEIVYHGSCNNIYIQC